MTYLEQRLCELRNSFPDVPMEALKAAMIEGVEAFAWYRDGYCYVGTTGKLRMDAVREIIEFGREAS